MYRLETTRSFEADLAKLDHAVAAFVLEKIEWLATHPELVPTPMRYLPKELSGLYKYRSGDYRIFFWLDHKANTMTLYRVRHRREAYKNW